MNMFTYVVAVLLVLFGSCLVTSNGQQYLGCMPKDNSHGLDDYKLMSSQKPSECLQFCRSKGYLYGAVNYM
jgi:hypothetical protein